MIHQKELPRRKKLLALTGLIICLLITLYIWHFFVQHGIERDRLRFEVESTSFANMLQKKLNQYVTLLGSVDSFYRSGTFVSREDFKRYVTSLIEHTEISGIERMEYIQVVKNENLEDFVNSVRNDTSLSKSGYPKFNVFPEGIREEYYVVNYVIPIRGEAISFGLDLGSNLQTRLNLLKARDYHKVIELEGISTLSELDPHRDELIFIHPVYQNGEEHATIEQRRQSFFGFIGIAIELSETVKTAASDYTSHMDEAGIMTNLIMDSEMNSNLYKSANYKPTIDLNSLSIAKSAEPDFNMIGYYNNLRANNLANNFPKFETQRKLRVAEDDWIIGIKSMPEYGKHPYLRVLPSFVLVIGIIVSGLLFAWVYSLLNAEYRATFIANSMTAELEASHAKLLELDNAKSDFLNIVSHELKTPLTAISAYLEIINDSGQNLTSEQLESIHAIQRNGNQLKIMISNILEVSRIESGKFEITPVEVDLRKKVEQIVNNLKILAENKKIYLTATVKNGEIVSIDEGKFEEILNNLIGNAIKFTEKGGINVEAIRDEKEIRINIIDTGIGIPQEKINKLFHNFYQVDASLGRRYGGTGLGLAISKKLVELQGGTISASSDLGKGSTFTFTLPLAIKH